MFLSTGVYNDYNLKSKDNLKDMNNIPKIRTEQDLLNALGIDDFRHMTKDKVIKFANDFKNIDSEVAMKCIEHFPEFSEYVKTLLEQFSNTFNNIITQADKVYDQQSAAYQKTLDKLYSILEKDNISEDERHIVAELVIEVHKQFDTLGDKRQRFYIEAMRCLAAIAAVAIAVGGSLLGLKMTNEK